ncbi:MAG: hypothetical protein R3C58_08925 [Parvularculaceae bacterium]
MSDHHNPDEKPGWADTKTFRRIFLGILVVACLLAALAGLVPAFKNPHPHFPAEEAGVFFAIYGFAAFAFIVLVGQHLRKLVGREERYYDDRE